MRKLYRSSRDRKLFGVCGGLAEYLGVDATLLRILLVVVAVFSAGSVVLVYIIAGMVIPREPFGFGPGNGPAAHSYGWPPGPDPRHQPNYGSPAWTPGAEAQGWTPGPGPGQPGPHAGHPGGAGSSKQGLDAMMDDIEKKALRREIEELKIKLAKIEKDSKGE